MTTIGVLTNELNRIFELFNAHYYDGQLEVPVILVQTNGGRTTNKGWCTSKRIWKNRELNQSYYEITICSEYLNQGIEDICSTLLHELVHLYSNQNMIKDTSRSGTYHNKRFKDIAEQHGLMTDYESSTGHGITSLTPEAKSFIHDYVQSNLFILYRSGDMPEESPEEKPGRKQSSIKYVCPNCDTIIRATKEVHVKCMSCDKEFQPSP